MMTSPGGARLQKLELGQETARLLKQNNLVRDLDRSGTPHLLIKVPNLEQALDAELGVEVDQAADGSISVSVLLYDIPTEPVTYEVRLRSNRADDQQYLRSFLDAARFRVHPCGIDSGEWLVGPPQTFELPNEVLLKLRHFAREWPGRLEAPSSHQDAGAEPEASEVRRSVDPRDTVIRKLKEQVQAMRDQLQERDKRIIELEDELHEIKSRGRPYKLTGEKKPWWKPFS